MILEFILPGVQHLQNIHPLVVHFPIALLSGSALFYALALIFRRNTFATTAFAVLLLGTISAAAAVATGEYAEEGVMISRSVRQNLLERHMDFMIATLVVSVILAVWAFVARPFPKRGRIVFVLLFLVLLVLITGGADYGGRMVYDYNAGGNACPQPIEFIK